MLRLHAKASPKRSVLLTSSRYNLGRWSYVYDLDAKASLQLIEFKEIVLVNDLPVPPKSFPPELGYLIMDHLVESLLSENDYQGAMGLLTLNRYYFKRFFKTYLGESHAVLGKKFARVSRLFHRLDIFHDILVTQDIKVDGLSEDDMACVEMKIKHPNLLENFFDPWHFDVPELSRFPEIILPGYPFTKVVAMGPIRLNTVLMANRNYIDSMSFSGGVLHPSILKHPFIVLALTMDSPVDQIVPNIDQIINSRSWHAFVALLIKGYGPNTGLYIAMETPNALLGFTLHEFPSLLSSKLSLLSAHK